MKLYACLPFVAAGAAFVLLPDLLPAPLNSKSDRAGLAPTAAAAAAAQSGENALRFALASDLNDDDLLDPSLDPAGFLNGGLLDDSLDSFLDGFDRPHHPHHPHHPSHDDRPTHEKTIYELVSTYKHTTKLTAFLQDYPDIIHLLNSTKAKHTAFIPLDHAFEHISKDKKPDKDVIEAIIKYHIGLGFYPSKRLIGTHTIPTLLNEELIGGKPQRLRTKLGFWGLTVNFYHKVVDRDIVASNGIIHAVNRIIYPPLLVGKELSLAPSIFSTLLFAYEKTEFVDEIHKIPFNGSTVFAPTNHAFEKLGMGVNAFLFNSPRGLKYLKALLKYHIAPNVTLYTDAMYDNSGADADTRLERPHGNHYHVDLHTLLDKQSIAVDIYRFHPLHCIKVNTKTSVAVSDVVARNGVIQVVSDVLFPHRHPPDAPEDLAEEDMTVEELVKILSPFVEGESTPIVFQDL